MEGMASFYLASRILGADSNLVQAMGGNTSFKVNGDLFVKASGTRLDEANEETFVQLSLMHCVNCLNDASLSLDDGLQGEKTNRRPSIETSLHAILPHPYVAHVHAVNSIAVSLQPDLNSAVSNALEGLAWGRLPYSKPGADLASLIHGIQEQQSVDVFLLENHGLVVGARSPGDMVNLVHDVESRLTALVRRTSIQLPDVAKLSAVSQTLAGFSPVNNIRVHSMAFDQIALDALRCGTLYPDHAILLGPGVVVAEDNQSLAAIIDREQQACRALIHTVVVPGEGVLIRDALPKASHEMLNCLADVTLRLQSADNLRALTREQVHVLINWEAERYRLTQLT